ncbi:SPFH domain-containing protein [Umezawaea tangerina]|uniref:Regulator of protease activity HflC (Stomatin/prohibitin superfamily) n=1 Tax=Umezawaea tangerina TaxID=84725 RepID=A0A2T0TE74_9PSEU|nr:SPFH domain-containing protein [Umezawaea tangerina]PRY43951.1 regulator of protease activity HflC (stomatin/prohibitin superfamily) [Umezawaea tangerina]
MADITGYPGLKHLRGTPTVHVRHVKHGKVVHDGTGLSFWFRPRSAVLSEVPVDDRELPMLFHARTADFQDVTVQMTLTYRVADPALAAARVDFSIDPGTGSWRGDPLAQIAGLLTESAQQHALDVLARSPLADALVDGVRAVRDRVGEGLGGDGRSAQTGITVVDVRVVAIRPEPEMEKALRTTAREQVQQEADRATYERRARAVERERAIGENELQNQIELAKREEQLVVQRGTNAKRQAEDAAAASAIETEAKANSVRELGEARAAAEAAHLAAYRDVPAAVLQGLALKELAGHLPKIDSLVVTPDMLVPLLAKLGAK